MFIKPSAVAGIGEKFSSKVSKEKVQIKFLKEQSVAATKKLVTEHKQQKASSIPTSHHWIG